MGWHQLTYASVEKSAGRPGGWGIVASSPGLPTAARERMLGGVVTRIEELVPTDEFAHRRELEARVRCFSYCPDGRSGTWWHAVVAGNDATGRPGNVFTHAVTTDRLESDTRPVDLWRSKDWLTPFGAAAVASSELGAIVQPGPSTETGVEFAMRQPQSGVEAVLSAFLSCFQDQRALVLAVSSPDEFIDWLRAISSLTSGSVAAQIPFCTFVRADSLQARTPRFEVLGLPREDLPRMIEARSLEGGPLVLDVANLPEQSPAEGWEHLGQRWTSGERWQDAYFLLTDGPPAQIAETLRCMDEIAAGVSPEDQLSPEWPLTLALLRRDGMTHNDARAIGAEWQRRRPFDGLTDPVLLQLLQGAHESAALTANDVDVPAPVVMAKGRSRDVLGGQGSHRALDTAFQLSPEHRALQVSLSVKALLAVLGAVEEGEREFVGDAILLTQGVMRPGAAGPVHAERVSELLSLRHKLPEVLVALLETWLQRYQESQLDEPEQRNE